MPYSDNMNIRNVAGWIIIILLFYLFYKLIENRYSEKRDVSYQLQSYDIPYIPKSIELKDKDTKLVKHLKFRFVYTCPERVYETIMSKSESDNIRQLFSYMKEYHESNGNYP